MPPKRSPNNRLNVPLGYHLQGTQNQPISITSSSSHHPVDRKGRFKRRKLEVARRETQTTLEELRAREKAKEEEEDMSGRDDFQDPKYDYFRVTQQHRRSDDIGYVLRGQRFRGDARGMEEALWKEQLGWVRDWQTIGQWAKHVCDARGGVVGGLV